MGIDIGTTSLKAAVFGRDGKRLGFRSVDYTLHTDPASGYIEFDAMEYVRMCKEVIDELTLECGEIEALSVDTQGETMILIIAKADERSAMMIDDPLNKQTQGKEKASEQSGAFEFIGVFCISALNQTTNLKRNYRKQHDTEITFDEYLS